MRKLVAVLLCVVMLCGCSAATEEPLSTIAYNTTKLEDISKHDGEQVTIVGYISMMSPLDNTAAYLMSTPFNADPTKNTSDSTVTDMVACYPPTGQYIKYTEECVKVTGTIKAKAMEKDASGYSYPFYLIDCTYEVYAGTDSISEYNYGITCGALAEVDNWLTTIYKGMSAPESAASIDADAKKKSIDTKIGDRACPSISKLVSNVDSLNTIYNDWVKTSPTEVTNEVTAAYMSMGTYMQEWLNNLQVKGNEQ